MILRPVGCVERKFFPALAQVCYTEVSRGVARKTSTASTCVCSVVETRKPSKLLNVGSNPTRHTLKVCPSCKIEKSRIEFHKNIHKKDGLQAYCKPCKKVHDSNYRDNHREYFTERAKRQYNDIAQYIRQIKESNPCADCGRYLHYCAMDFDHLNSENKIDSVANLMSKGMKAVKEEIDKCELVCAVCHRIRTWQRKYGSLA